ncbi:hypothetical protein Tco_0129066 [Tanacetum coccineum]
MSSMQEDIQCAGSDTRPPMLDRTDFESWQQRIRLYCLGKDNGENIMKSIKEGPFQMGTVSDVITGGTEGAVQQGPVRARVLNDLSAEEKERYKADIRATNILTQGLPRTSTSLFNHYLTLKTLGKRVDDSGSSSTENLIESLSNSLALLTQSYKSHLPQTNNQLRASSNARNNAVVQDGRVVVQDVRGRYNANNQGRPFQRNNVRGNIVTGNVGGQNRGGNDSDYFKDKMLLMQAQENGAVLDEEQLLFLAGEQVTNFDDDVDDPTEKDLAFNVDHIFEADQYPIYNEVGPSYDSNTPFEVQDHDTFIDHMDEYHEYMEDNEEHVVQSNVSSVRNDAMMSIIDDMHEQGVQSMLANKPHMVVNDSVTSELARYKELVGEYEKRAKFELTDRERKIDEQMRIIISDRNRKETSLKSELHSAQILLSSTVDHYKSKTEEVTLLKKDFKQKEDKFLEEFLDIKKLKDKIEDRLYKQDQSVQTVHMLCQPKSFYDEKHKVAIGYKNPLCLARAKQAQSALYNGHVLVTTNHAPTIIHDSEDTLELAAITRNRMRLKMQSPLCMENKVRIAPPDYSKENLLATFAPQRNLTPEQIFWSIDDNNRKKAETLAPKPISALTVYPPNTPVKLVPRILPTKSQVKINLYVLTQLFTEFDKTCKTRITPSGLTEGERGFEQTKRCYLTEVIPFFKTLKEHFVGVQKALFKEVKEMEEIFDQMNNEVDKNTVDKQCAEIEKKNLLIENENLIVNCLSTQLLYDVEKSRCLDLEADMSKVHDESKLISKLERECLNLQLKYQHLQESFDNKNSQASQEAPDFNSFFKIKNLEHQIKEKDNVIRHLKDLVASVNDRSREPHNDVDVTALIEQNDCDRVELEKVKQHYKELYDSIKITRAHTSEKTSTMLNEIESLKAQLRSKEPCFTSDYVKPKVLAPGMYAIDVKPIPHPLKNNRSAHLNYISHLKESVETVREIVEEARVVKPLDSSLNYACRYTKLSQELLECVIGTCPKSFNERDNKAPSTPVTRKKQVTFSDKPGTSSSNTQKHKVHQRVQLTNIPVLPSTGVNDSTEASGSKPRSNTKKNRILPAKKENKKEVEYGMCVVNILNSRGNATPTVDIVLNKEKQIWKPKAKLTLLKTICRGEDRSKLMSFVEKFHESSDSRNDHLGAITASKSQIMVMASSFNPFKLGTINDLARKDLVSGSTQLKLGNGISLLSLVNLEKARNYMGKVLRSKDETLPEFSSPFLKQIQVLAFFHQKSVSENSSTKMALLERSKRQLENLGKFQAKADIGIFVGPRLSSMTPGQLKSGLAPTDNELEMLFQPIFDEHLEQSRVNEPVPSATEINAQVVPPGTSSCSTIIVSPRCTVNNMLHVNIDHSTSSPTSRNSQEGNPLHDDTPSITIFLNPSLNLVTGDPGLVQYHLGMKNSLASDALWCCFSTELVQKFEPKNFKNARDRRTVVSSMHEKFTNSDQLEKKSFVSQPEGFEDQGIYYLSYRLKEKALLWANSRLKGVKYGTGSLLNPAIHQWWMIEMDEGRLGIPELTKLDSEEMTTPLALTAYADAGYHAGDVKIQKEYVGKCSVSWSRLTSSPKQCQGERFEFLLPRLGMKSLTSETLKRLQEGEDE